MAAALPTQSCQPYHGILSVSKFATNPNVKDIQTELKQQQQSSFSKVKGTLGKELPKNLECLMGNGVNITDIDAAIQHLAHRNYPESFDTNGSKCGKIQICVPDIYLRNKDGVKFVQTDPKTIAVDGKVFKDELGNLGKATTVTGRLVEGATKLVKLLQPFVPNQPGPNPMRDLMIAQGGDEAEKEFFKKIRQILEKADEEFALFQSHELFKFNLKDNLNKHAEKDFIIVNFTHRYVCDVEVKRTLGKGNSIGSSARQLKDTKAALESWFSLELNKTWSFIPFVYCQKVAVGTTICCNCSPYIIEGESEIENKFSQIIVNLKSQNTCLSTSEKTVLEKDFANLVKYLAFAACAAKAPITQSLTKEIDDRVQIAGSPENIERWMFWTVPQATFFANATSQQKVLLLGGNGVGKTVLMIERAKQLAIKEEEVVFCIGDFFIFISSHDPMFGPFFQKTLLQLQLEIEFEEFYKENPTSRKIRVEGLHSYDPSKHHLNNTHVFIDELQGSNFQIYATLRTKSLWVAATLDDDDISKFKDVNEAINNYKVKYPGWYIPFFNFILRTTKYIAEELKSSNRSELHYQYSSNNESRLNHMLDIPQNIQEGPKPVTLEFMTSKQFCKNVLSTFKELAKNDVALIVLVPGPIQSMSSKAINDFKTNFPKYSNLVSSKSKSMELTLAFLMQSIKASGREHPLIWSNYIKQFNSNEDQIKDWIRGKSKCDLIVDQYLIAGFEASTCLTFSSINQFSAISRTKVKHIQFTGKYYDVELP